MVGKKQIRMKKWATVYMIIAIAVGVAMIPQLNKFGAQVSMFSAENEFMYEKAIHILVMLLMGFGFLMMFVKRYGYTSITTTFLVVASEPRRTMVSSSRKLQIFESVKTRHKSLQSFSVYRRGGKYCLSLYSLIPIKIA